jgi:hypothetical protein
MPKSRIRIGTPVENKGLFHSVHFETRSTIEFGHGSAASDP